MLFDLAGRSYVNIGTVIMSSAALFLLAGMALYTRLYRIRGRLEDRLFFAMLVTDIIAAFADGMNNMLESSPVSRAGDLIIAGDTLFTLAFECFAFLFVLYADARAYQDPAHTRKRLPLYAVPFVLEIPVILGNLPGRYLFTVDEANRYHFGEYYPVIFLATAVYGLIGVMLLARIDARLILTMLLMVIVRLFGGRMARGISSTPFVYAVGLVYIQILRMNRGFYDEEESV